MKEVVQDIFDKAGVSLSAADEDPIKTLENWLDLEDLSCSSKSWDPLNSGSLLSMEDSAPYPSSFYRNVGQLLVSVWHSQSASADKKSEGIRSGFEHAQESNLEQTSLFHVPTVRITRLLRHWMELNVMGSNHSDQIDHMTLSELLLKHCEGNTNERESLKEDVKSEKKSGDDNDGKGQRLARRVPIVNALFHYISELPQLQYQVHSFVQGLLGRNQFGPETPSAERIEKLKASNALSQKLNQELDDHLQHLEDILGEWYSVCNPALRVSFRKHLGRLWLGFVNNASGATRSTGFGRLENTSACGIAQTLRVLNRILMGVRIPLHASYEHLLVNLLVPLHRPSSMVLWRDQTPLLDLYHIPLVQCIAVLLQKDWTWISRTVSLLLQPDVWPSSEGAGTASTNTPKVVLLLHEIDTYIGLLPKPLSAHGIESFHDTIGPLTVRLGVCISSDNSRMSERALQFFQNEVFVSIIKNNLERTVPTLLRALCRTSDHMQLPWNPTVRKMTRLVLNELERYDAQTFAESARYLTSRNEENYQASSRQAVQTQRSPDARGTAPMKEDQPSKQDFSLKAGMGDWKPPTRRTRHSNMLPPPPRPPSSARGGSQPPLTVTGIAPWTRIRGGEPSSGGASAAAPPLTVTGVAPWANRTPSRQSKYSKSKGGNSVAETLPEDDTEEIPPSTALESLSEVKASDNDNAGLAKVRDYVERLKPPTAEEDDDGTSSWAKAQMAESPTLLPTLKFHDLVFGDDLGSGAFGVVRYARQIVKTKTRSHWPEYAVKVVSTQKIEELGYEQSINREIATLRVMSHPGIARLISSFRFGDGAYLVLEYASGGDLHSLLLRSGSLDHDSTKFVIGSIVAALASIHDLGFVYGDLKPENVLITETKHIKLTDFGGCRPVTIHAKDLIRASGTNSLKELRDGDWKPSKRKYATEGTDEIQDGSQDMEMDEEEDQRIEGTTAYLPPEVVMGAVPDFAADSWALGCVLFQCFSGRPPMLEDDDSSTRQKIVSFHMSSPSSGRESLFVGIDDSAAFQPQTRNLVLTLLSRNPSNRPGMIQIAEDAFFDGTNVFALHKNPGYPLDVGSVAPVSDAKWSRRQFSSIWAPQPESYIVAVDTDRKTASSVKNTPVLEGEEAGAFFSSSLGPGLFRNIPENISVS